LSTKKESAGKGRTGATTRTIKNLANSSQCMYSQFGLSMSKCPICADLQFTPWYCTTALWCLRAIPRPVGNIHQESLSPLCRFYLTGVKHHFWQLIFFVLSVKSNFFRILSNALLLGLQMRTPNFPTPRACRVLLASCLEFVHRMFW
jgi:hypothetical protein